MKKRVLLVDDDKDLVQSVKVVLEANGFEVATEHNGAGALAAVAAHRPDLIVLDVMMDTDAEGFGVAYRLESDPATRRIPIVLMTGFMDHMAAKREAFDFITGREWPAAKLMKKPVAMSELVAAIRELLAEGESLKAALA
jgi:two-component system, OmpR family, alkaline phosphatase synthesis response regulator PhoP